MATTFVSVFTLSTVENIITQICLTRRGQYVLIKSGIHEVTNSLETISSFTLSSSEMRILTQIVPASLREQINTFCSENVGNQPPPYAEIVSDLAQDLDHMDGISSMPVARRRLDFTSESESSTDFEPLFNISTPHLNSSASINY